MDSKQLYLIDGSAYIYRAYHAIRGLSNSSGMPTNAIFGFTKMLMKLVEERSPDYVGMCFDAKGPTFRHEMYPSYKANRPPMPEDLVVQLPLIKKVTRGFNIPVVEQKGFEADDLIGTLAVKGEAAGFQVVIVTGDKDFMQLVTPSITIWDPMKNKTIDTDSIQKDLGVRPGQIIDVMGLWGDTADNVPGVPGIGQKTALALIKRFGSMDEIYTNIVTITQKKQKENLGVYKEQAELSRKLVTIDTDAPVSWDPEALKYCDPDTQELSTIFAELEFHQLQQAFTQKADQADKDYRAVLTKTDLADLAARLKTAERIAVDTETTSVNPMEASLVGISFAIMNNQAWYIPCAHNYLGVPEQLSLEEIFDHIKPILENPEIKKIGQNIKYDWIVLSRHGINLAGVAFDTMLASYLLNPSKRAHNLDQISLDFLGHKTITYADVVGKGKSALDSFARVPIDQATPYACEDADITLQAYEVLKPELEKSNLLSLLESVEMPLVAVLMRMEMNGISVDKEQLKTLSVNFQEQLDALEIQIYELAGERFNIRSSQQLGYILFEKLALPVVKKTRKKTAYSTDVDVLTTLAEKHEMPAVILRHRTLSKLKSTYADALIGLINNQTGRIHTSFNQTITATGRLSSSDPNLQNIPVRTEEGRLIRKAFIPKNGWRLVAADYSQIELRILAHCSQDPILIKAFEKGEDVHDRTAAEVFQVFPQFIDKELRRQAKIINFGIIYGMSPFGLSKALGISQKMAKTYIESYFARYRGVREFIDKTIEETREAGKVSTLLGRIRLLPEINSTNRNIRMFGERTAVNTPIQGSAADLIKVAMIDVDIVFREKRLKTNMLLSVHDEIVFESPPEELEDARSLVKEKMEGVWKLDVPLVVNLKEGDNWDF